MKTEDALEVLVALLKHFALAPIKGTAGGVILEKSIDTQKKKRPAKYSWLFKKSVVGGRRESSPTG